MGDVDVVIYCGELFVVYGVVVYVGVEVYVVVYVGGF